MYDNYKRGGTLQVRPTVITTVIIVSILHIVV